MRGLLGRGANAGWVQFRSRIFHESPRISLPQNLLGEARMQRMPAAMDHQMALNRMANQCQIPHDVENLVAHELVLETQRIQHAGLAEYDRILE